VYRIIHQVAQRDSEGLAVAEDEAARRQGLLQRGALLDDDGRELLEDPLAFRGQIQDFPGWPEKPSARLTARTCSTMLRRRWMSSAMRWRMPPDPPA